MKDRPLPESPKAEKSVLSEILIEPFLYEKAVSKGITEASFNNIQNKAVYRAIAELCESGQDLDLTTLCEHFLTAKIEFDVNWISEISGFSFTTVNFESHLKILKEKEAERKLYTSGAEIQNMVLNHDNIHDIIKTIEDSALIAKKILNEHERTNLRQALIQIVEQSKNPEKVFLCGIYGADKALSLKRKELHVLGAAPGTGKTGFCLNAMLGQARLGYTTALFCGETSSRQLYKRLISICACVPTFVIDDMRQSTIPQVKAIEKAMAELKKYEDKIFIFGKGDYKHSPSGIRAELKTLKQETNNELGVVYIDYLQNMRPDGYLLKLGRVDQIESMIFDMNETLGELNLCGTILCQLNRDRDRGEKNKQPDIYDLKGSSAIEQEADIITFLHKKDKDATGVIDIYWYSRKVRGADEINLITSYNTITSVYNVSHKYGAEDEPQGNNNQEKDDGKSYERGNYV